MKELESQIIIDINQVASSQVLARMQFSVYCEFYYGIKLYLYNVIEFK